MANRKGSSKLSIAIDERLYKALNLKKTIDKINITKVIEEYLNSYIEPKYFKMIDELEKDSFV